MIEGVGGGLGKEIGVVISREMLGVEREREMTG